MRIGPGQTFTMAEISGSGAIQHMWLTPTGTWRFAILRMYWDGEAEPSVEVPVGDFFGADGFVSAWHNRNIRIYSNIVRTIRSPEERLLVIIGAGHVPILRQALGASPVVQLVNVDPVLR